MAKSPCFTKMLVIPSWNFLKKNRNFMDFPGLRYDFHGWDRWVPWWLRALSCLARSVENVLGETHRRCENDAKFHCIIWYTMIYYDIVNIVVWYDMIWYDMIWYDMIWYDMIWYDMIWYDMIWYDMIWYDMIWYDMIWYDMIWCMISYKYSITWYDMIWYDMIWCSTILL